MNLILRRNFIMLLLPTILKLCCCIGLTSCCKGDDERKYYKLTDGIRNANPYKDITHLTFTDGSGNEFRVDITNTEYVADYNLNPVKKDAEPCDELVNIEFNYVTFQSSNTDAVFPTIVISPPYTRYQRNSGGTIFFLKAEATDSFLNSFDSNSRMVARVFDKSYSLCADPVNYCIDSMTIFNKTFYNISRVSLDGQVPSELNTYYFTESEGIIKIERSFFNPDWVVIKKVEYLVVP